MFTSMQEPPLSQGELTQPTHGSETYLWLLRERKN